MADNLTAEQRKKNMQNICCLEPAQKSLTR